MSFPLYLDEDSMNAGLVQALRRAGVTVLSVSETGRRGRSDEDQLAYASSIGHVLLSANQRDFVRLHTSWLMEGKSHAGIISVTEQRIPVGLMRTKLLYIQRRPLTAMKDTIVFINGRPLGE